MWIRDCTGRPIFVSQAYTPVGKGSIAQANRHTGKAHEHKREIARRLRQQG